MDPEALRQLVGACLTISHSCGGTRTSTPSASGSGCRSLPPEGEYSKRVRVSRSLAALDDAELPAVADRIVTGTMPFSSGPAARFATRGRALGRPGRPGNTKRTRRAIARDLDHELGALTGNADQFMAPLASACRLLPAICGSSASLSGSRFGNGLPEAANCAERHRGWGALPVHRDDGRLPEQVRYSSALFRGLAGSNAALISSVSSFRTFRP